MTRLAKAITACNSPLKGPRNGANLRGLYRDNGGNTIAVEPSNIDSTYLTIPLFYGKLSSLSPTTSLLYIL